MPLQRVLSRGLSGARSDGGVATTGSSGTDNGGTEDGGDPVSDLTRCGQSLE
jgi:hypothetical protein